MTFLAITGNKDNVTTFCFPPDVSPLAELAAVHVKKQNEEPILYISVPDLQALVPQNARTFILFQALHDYFEDHNQFLDLCPKNGDFRIAMYWLPDTDAEVTQKMRQWAGLA